MKTPERKEKHSEQGSLALLDNDDLLLLGFRFVLACSCVFPASFFLDPPGLEHRVLELRRRVHGFR